MHARMTNYYRFLPRLGGGETGDAERLRALRRVSDDMAWRVGSMKNKLVTKKKMK